MAGWIGVDLDGTAAKYDGWKGPTEIGEPILPMIARIRAWRARGIEVRIFTARVAISEITEELIERVLQHGIECGQPLESVREAYEHIVAYQSSIAEIRKAIEAWCLEHVGEVLPVTNVKDFGMVCLYDDRAIQVEINTGRLIGAEEE
jgi:hypothetical protein